ncbi:hypothetical protein EXS65_02090 [Candidatus Peribacteria bacterium]|nr:hypothetical protein [Candidatus Peribacteria bacterium]
MNRSLKAIVTVSTVIACLSGSLAIAGGLSSKDKARTPFAAGALTTMGAHSQPVPRFLTKKQRTQLAISAKIQRNIRAQTRTLGTPKSAGKPVLFSTSTEYVNPQLIVDRERLVKRGMSAHPIRCAKLHTHARATCQRDAQLQRRQVIGYTK